MTDDISNSWDPVPCLILPSLFIGSADHAENLEILHKHEITHILTVASDMTPKYPEKFQYLHIDIWDMDDQDIKQHFVACLEFIEKARASGVVLVHCVAGMSRSATICIAYLMHIQKIGVDDALARVKAARPIIYPNDGFLRQLREYEDEILPKPEPPADPPKQLSKSGAKGKAAKPAPPPKKYHSIEIRTDFDITRPSARKEEQSEKGKQKDNGKNKRK